MIAPRATVLTAAPYQPPPEGRRQKIRLDFNENTVGFPWALPDANIYPEYQQFHEQLAAFWQLSPDQLLLTNGSDEALFLVPFTFIEPGQDHALISFPTFQMIPHYLSLVGATVVQVPVLPEGLAFDVSGLGQALEVHRPKLAVFATPDNPTGALLHPEQVAQWCHRHPETLFLIDEAYGEYSPSTCLPLIETCPNLLVTRSFSKAWGLAGLRLGMIAGAPELIEWLKRVRSPYSVNMLAVAAAQRLLEDAPSVQDAARQTMRVKTDFVAALESRGYRVTPGNANFLLLHSGWEADALCQHCENEDILVRNRTTVPGMTGLIRVTVGTEAENTLFLSALDTFRQERALIFDLDDTLVDTSESFDVTVMELVKAFSGQPLMREELTLLRAEGGFNDDWDATVELLRRRDVLVTRSKIAEAGSQIYHRLAPKAEKLLVSESLLARLAKRFRLMILTGRYRAEFDPLWSERLTPYFERVVCRDDFPDLPPKPAPDQLLALMGEMGVKGGVYVGNSVDDMQAAQAAGLVPVGVATTQTEAVLLAAGAFQVVSGPKVIQEALDCP
jgi:histidinol-phosphate aminotransferase